MTYFPDLTPYSYYWEETPCEPEATNIGWLSRDFPFPQGKTPVEFRRRLRLFSLDEHIVRLSRGYHKCELCDVSEEQWVAESSSRFGKEAHFAGIGCGEIRAQGETVVYAAPALILHYVTAHDYKPPEVFVEAILNGPQPGSPEHQALLAQWR